ncbi:MAG TPA: M4 family metallopeptidase [Edaphocola sp.]|nr:M4 family metallopeptidase [Edaphocola sp.]
MNKKLLFLLAFMGGSLFSYAQTEFQTKYFKDGMYVFDDLLKIRQGELFTVYKSEFNLSDADEMRMTNNQVLQNGTFRTKYELYNHGVRVQGALMNVLGEKGIVERADGFLMPDLDVDTTNLITAEEAISSAISYLDADKYIWQDSTLEAEYKESTGDPAATLYPQTAQLIIAHKVGTEYTADNYALCYLVQLSTIDPVGKTDVYVDAHTGAGFTQQDALEKDYSVTNGSLWTRYNGQHNDLTTTTCTFCSQFWLHDLNRHINTVPYDYSWNYEIKDQNNNWVESATQTAASAQWCLERAWDYFYNVHGRAGTDYNHKQLIVYINDYVHFNSANAAYSFNSSDDDVMYISPDDNSYSPSADGYSMAMLDVLAHEYTHGMIHRSSELGSLGDFEAHSLNEGYADIFGQMAENYTMGTNDWIVGDHTDGLERHFDNPHADNPHSPEIYLEPGYWSTTDFHRDDGVLRKWFYLLSNGGTFNGSTVQGIGSGTAAEVAYITFNWWLWSNVTYPEAAQQTSAETIADFGGKCSEVHKQTVNALRAVGFNVAVPFCLDPDIIGDAVISVVGEASATHVWTVALNDIPDHKGTYQWEIPEGWTARTNGDSLIVDKLSDFGNYNSTAINVTYTTPGGQQYHASKIVHFSDYEWTPINYVPQGGGTAQSMVLADLPVMHGMTIYPNPAQSTVRVLITEDCHDARLSIMDMSGRVLKSRNVNGQYADIDISDMADGVYQVRLQTGKHLFTKKLTVNH